MPNAIFYLNCCAIIGLINATALSFEASSYGYNTSSKSILTPSGAFPGREISLIGSKTSPIAPSAYNFTTKNNTAITSALSSSACCFVVQDTIDVRYWFDYVTNTTILSNRTTSFITFATQYIDTIVMTNVSTVVKTVNYTSNVAGSGIPTIPNTYNEAPGPSLTQIGLSGSFATIFGATITSPTQFYVFSSVNIINVPAVSDEDGHLVCATTSTYRAMCPAQTYAKFNSTATGVDNNTRSARPPSALYISGINSHVASYFATGQSTDSAIVPPKYDLVRVSFSTPFVYAPRSDHFPSSVFNENIGYVPQALIEFMAQKSDYVSDFQEIASCLPGGPSANFFNYFCNIPEHSHYYAIDTLGIQVQEKEPELTFSTTVTIAGRGCFHPGACPTTAATPGAAAVAAIPAVTPKAGRPRKFKPYSTALAEDTSPPTSPDQPSPPQAQSQPLPAPVGDPGKTPMIYSDKEAVTSPPNPLPDSPSPSPPNAVIQSPSASRDSWESLLGKSSENSQGEEIPPNNPAKPPSSFQGLGVIIANNMGITPPTPQMIQPNPALTSKQSYSISIAPSASAVVINGITSILPAVGAGGRFVPEIMPIAMGSQQISQNAVSQYLVGSQTLTPGAPPISLQGTDISLAPSGSAIVIAGSTIVLSSTNAPAFTVGAEIITANSNSEYTIAGRILTPGAPAITVSGTPISLAPDGTQIIVGSSTIGLAPATTPLLLKFGSQIFTANSASEYIIDGQTLIPGAPALTISNTPISLASDASKVVIDGSTETLRSGPTLPPLIIGSQTFTANNAGAYVIGSQTLMPGASGIVVPGSLLFPGLPSSVFTVAGQVFTANPTAFSIDGTTISVGGPGVTICGTPVSLQASGVLDIGSSSITLSSATSPNGPGLAAFSGKGDRTAVRLLYSVLASVLSMLIAVVV